MDEELSGQREVPVRRGEGEKSGRVTLSQEGTVRSQESCCLPRRMSTGASGAAPREGLLGSLLAIQLWWRQAIPSRVSVTALFLQPLTQPPSFLTQNHVDPLPLSGGRVGSHYGPAAWRGSADSKT